MDTTYRLTQKGSEVQTDLNNAEQDHVSLAEHEANSDIHVTSQNKTDWNAKYNKPGTGIPLEDLAQAVQQALAAALSAYQKPNDGIPASDLAAAVQSALAAAMSAYQKPSGGIPSSDFTTAVQNALTAALSAYQKPNTGIPAADLSAAVQSALTAATGMQQSIDDERDARAAADLNLSNLIGTKTTQAQVEALIASALVSYSTTSEMASAISTALASYYTKTQTDSLLADKQTAAQVSAAITSALTAYYTKTAMDALLAQKQDKLTFDLTPTNNSQNPVTSDGIYDAIQSAVSGLLNTQQVQTLITNALASYSTTAQVASAISTALADYSTTTAMTSAINAAIAQEVIDRTAAVNAETTARQQADQQLQQQISGTYQAATQAATAAQQAQQQAGNAATEAENAAASAQAAADKLTELEEDIQALPDGQAVSAEVAQLRYQMDNEVLMKGEYSADTAVGLADQLRGSVYADEQFAVRMTGGEANEVGGIGVVQQLKGAGAAIVQLFPEGSGHDFSGDVSLDGTGGNAEAVVRYSNEAQTVEMGYLLCLEAFVSQTLSQAQLDAISAKDSGKADRDKAVWLTPAGAITSAPTIESGQTEVTFSGWRIAMRVKASEVRDASASGYWFTSGTAGRQVFDVAVAEGIDENAAHTSFWLANGWDTKSALEYLNHMAAQGLPTHSVKAMSALLAVTKIGIKTVKSRNLLNPQTGRALLKAYVNDDENFLDNEYTMLGGLPSGSTMAFTSLLTGKTETLTMLDATHFVIPSDGWLQITGTLPTSIICTWGGEKDNTAADEYATESHVWDVTQLFGTKDGGTEGHYYRFAKEGMKGAGSAQDVVELVGAEGSVKCNVVDLGTLTWSQGYTNGYWANIDNGIAGYNKIWNVIVNKYPYNKTAGIGGTNWTYPDVFYKRGSTGTLLAMTDKNSASAAAFKTKMSGVYAFYELATPLTFTSLFLSASSTADELTQMPADAIPLSEIQFADNNWSIEEAIYDAPEADANGVIDTLHQCTGQMRIQYSLDAAEQIDTLQKEYQALEARVAALENA